MLSKVYLAESPVLAKHLKNYRVCCTLDDMYIKNDVNKSELRFLRYQLSSSEAAVQILTTNHCTGVHYVNQMTNEANKNATYIYVS